MTSGHAQGHSAGGVLQTASSRQCSVRLWGADQFGGGDVGSQSFSGREHTIEVIPTTGVPSIVLIFRSLSLQDGAYFCKHFPSGEKIKYACVLKLSMHNRVLKYALMESISLSCTNIVTLGWPGTSVHTLEKLQGWGGD